MDGPGGRRAQGREPATRGQKPCGCSGRRALEEPHPQRQKADGGCQGWGGPGELVFHGDGGSDLHVLETGGGDGCTEMCT